MQINLSQIVVQPAIHRAQVQEEEPLRLKESSMMAHDRLGVDPGRACTGVCPVRMEFPGSLRLELHMELDSKRSWWLTQLALLVINFHRKGRFSAGGISHDGS